MGSPSKVVEKENFGDHINRVFSERELFVQAGT